MAFSTLLTFFQLKYLIKISRRQSPFVLLTHRSDFLHVKRENLKISLYLLCVFRLASSAAAAVDFEAGENAKSHKMQISNPLVLLTNAFTSLRLCVHIFITFLSSHRQQQQQQRHDMHENIMKQV